MSVLSPSEGTLATNMPGLPVGETTQTSIGTDKRQVAVI